MGAVVLVIDRQSVFRSGLRNLIETAIPHSQVIEASEVDAIDGGISFDLVLIDWGSPTSSSTEALETLIERNPRARCAMLSTSNARDTVLGCLSAGFHGFVHKLQSDQALIAAVKDLLTGRIVVPPWLADSDETRTQTFAARADTTKLTPRQREILPLIAGGMSSKQIARLLSISVGTTKIHTAALLKAIGARNRAAAAFMAATLINAPTPDRLTGARDNGVVMLEQSAGTATGRDPSARRPRRFRAEP